MRGETSAVKSLMKPTAEATKIPVNMCSSMEHLRLSSLPILISDGSNFGGMVQQCTTQHSATLVCNHLRQIFASCCCCATARLEHQQAFVSGTSECSKMDALLVKRVASRS